MAKERSKERKRRTDKQKIKTKKRRADIKWWEKRKTQKKKSKMEKDNEIEI